MPNRQQNIVILGAGESGIGAALLCQKQGHRVFVSSISKIAEKHLATLQKNKIAFEEGQNSWGNFQYADLVIKSPGIPAKAEIIQRLAAANIPTVGEIGYGAKFLQGKLIAITGSNGKTTTTSLLYHILKKAGLNVSVGGNIGTSLCRLLAEENQPKEYYVIEVSSFQLDDAPEIKPYIGIITNITPDHLDRYEYQLEKYVASKFQIAANQTKEDYFIYCNDDPITMEYIDKYAGDGTKIPFGFTALSGDAAFVQNNEINISIHKESTTMRIDELALQGKHNTYNSMAAGLASRLLKIRKESIRESLSDFEAIEHRLEPVIEVVGVEYINDSKATNVNSTYYALESMKKPTIWIAGGVDKGNDYSQLKNIVKSRVKAIICLGQDVEKIHQAFGEDIEFILDTESMEEAVMTAHNLAQKGDAVLLSPACASFDLFESYEERGRVFKQVVRNL